MSLLSTIVMLQTITINLWEVNLNVLVYEALSIPAYKQ